MEDSKNFSGKVVIITGSTSGIGEGIAIYFSKLGANVVITGRNEQNVKRVAEVCESVSPKQIQPLKVVADITIDSDAKRLIDTTIEKFGKIDVLVNNAGIYSVNNILDENLMETYGKIMRLNLRSVVILTQLSMDYLVTTKGNIINISSNSALKPYENEILYGMSKAALDMFTKCMAIELGPKNIRVNAINAGLVESNIFEAVGISKEDKIQMFETFKSLTPLRIVGEPQDIANMVAFLASNDAKFITGSCVVVDAGLVL